MTSSTAAQPSGNYREATDHNGRVYRIGETDRDIMARPRWTMVILPWVAMMAISSSEYAFTSAEETLADAHGWHGATIFWLLGVWVFFQAIVAFPAGKMRENGTLSAKAAMLLGATGTLFSYLALAYSPNEVWAYLGFGFFGGGGAGLVYATCVNMVGKWYPERRGGKTGFVNGGFAYGSVPFIFIFTSYMDLSNYSGVLLAVGLFLAAVVGVSGCSAPASARWSWSAGATAGRSSSRAGRACSRPRSVCSCVSPGVRVRVLRSPSRS